MQDFCGVILAGGASRRMGRDKAGIPHGDVSFLEHMTRVLKQAGASQVCVLGRPDLPNGVPDRSPLAGPVAALADYLADAAHGSRHLVVPVDMPCLDAASLRLLAREPGWACFDGHMLPLLAIADGGLTRTRRLRDLLTLKAARCLPASSAPAWALVNLNTPDDLNHWRQHAPHMGVSEHV